MSASGSRSGTTRASQMSSIPRRSQRSRAFVRKVQSTICTSPRTARDVIAGDATKKGYLSVLDTKTEAPAWSVPDWC